MKNQEQARRAPLYKFLLVVLLLTQSFVLHELWNVKNNEARLRAIAKKASRSVGRVLLVKNGKILSSGSCFVTQLSSNEVNDDTIIVTIAHIFPDSLTKDDSVKIMVGFLGREKLLEVAIQIKDEESDFAVIAPLDTTKYSLPPPLTLGNSSALEIFNEVLLIGTHYDIYNVFSKGYILEPMVGRQHFGNNAPYNHFTFILSNVPAGHGKSGGPLLNINGEVVGVHHGMWQSLSIDIPSDELIHFLSLHALEIRK